MNRKAKSFLSGLGLGADFFFGALGFLIPVLIIICLIGGCVFVGVQVVEENSDIRVKVEEVDGVSHIKFYREGEEKKEEVQWR